MVRMKNLSKQSNTLSHAEEIKSALYEASSALSAEETGCESLARKASERLNDIADVYSEVKDTAARLDSLYIDLKDIAQEIDNRLENIDFDPQQLETINARLDLIYSLEQKFHAESVSELLQQQQQLARLTGEH